MQTKSKAPFKILYAISFIFSLQYALVVYINSSFLEQTISEKFVGLIFTCASILSILFLLEMPRILNRLGNYRTSILFVILNATALLLLAISTAGFIKVVSFLLYVITNYCLVLTRDVFIEDYTKNKNVGRTWGIFLTIINLALILSQPLAVFLLAKGSYFGVYASAALFSLSALLFIIPHMKNFEDPIYRRISVWSTFKTILKDKNLKKIYISEFLLCFFYAWMIIYMPIYLHQHMGFTWANIGTIFSIMLIPFILVDYPLGKISDRVGEKKILAVGFFILSISTIGVFLLKSQNIFMWASILFLTRVGAATIEIMNSSYFFKKISPSDAGLISFFRNMFPLAFVVAPLIAIPVLLYVPSFKFLFVVLSAIMMLGFLISLRIRDVK
ncbi:MAG: MFS transporter [Candidatus Paceibacterota bacterium]